MNHKRTDELKTSVTVSQHNAFSWTSYTVAEKGQLLTTAITTYNTIRNNIKVTFSMYLGRDVFIYL